MVVLVVGGARRAASTAGGEMMFVFYGKEKEGRRGGEDFSLIKLPKNFFFVTQHK